MTAFRLPLPWARSPARRWFAGLALVLSALSQPHAQAGESVDVRVTATVLAVCKVQSVRDILFGTLDPSQPVDSVAEGGVTFMCTRGVDYRLVVDKGRNYDAASGRRRMKDQATNYLPYRLAAESFAGIGMGFREPAAIVLSASIFGADYRDAPAGQYSDTLRVIIEP